MLLTACLSVPKNCCCVVFTQRWASLTISLAKIPQAWLFGNLAVRFAREFELFAQLDRDVWHVERQDTSESYIRGLKRLRLDITLYPRLTMSLGGPQSRVASDEKIVQYSCKKRCILTSLEATQVFDDILAISRNTPLTKTDSVSSDFKVLRWVLSDIRATANSYLVLEESKNLSCQQNRASREFVPAQNWQTDLQRQKSCLSNDNLLMSLTSLLPWWTGLDIHKEWSHASPQDDVTISKLESSLFARFACSRWRVEIFRNLYHVKVMPNSIISRNLQAAQATLSSIIEPLNW